MRKIAAIGLAAALATASVGATVQSAQAGVPGSFVTGLIVGGIAGALLAPHFHSSAYAAYPAYPAYPAAAYPVANAHVAWCQAHYPRSYNPVTNTFIGRRGVVYQCVSPY